MSGLPNNEMTGYPNEANKTDKGYIYIGMRMYFEFCIPKSSNSAIV